MAIYRKPNSPLQHKDGDYFYPLTTVDQVIVDDNTRLSSKLDHILTVDFSDVKDAKASGINADTLGGFPAEDFVKHGDYSFVDKPKAGFIYPLATATIPEGFLLCDGAEYSREEYPELFIAIGTTYGSGNGSTTFNVPNLQTRVPIGSGENYKLGSIGGEETHTLTVDEMPKHDHTSGNNPTTGNIGYAGDNTGSTLNGFGLSWTKVSTRTNLGIKVAENGNDQPHNNMQPYTVVNYIIATGKDSGISVHDIITGVQALPLGVEYGGTGATNVEDAQKNLGLNDTYNYLDNSDFTQWIAQVEFGSSHAGSVLKYAGDRWILDSGTVTGDVNENGNGYTNIVLNGTIRQIVANPPTIGSVFVEMVSGTAEAVYENGEVTITSNGGMIRNVLLCEGQYTASNKPKYQPKGYGTELYECMRYFQTNYIGFHASGRWAARSNIYHFNPPMRVRPSVVSNGHHTGNKNVYDYWDESTNSYKSLSGVNSSATKTNVTFTNADGLFVSGCDYSSLFEASADFPEED